MSTITTFTIQIQSGEDATNEVRELMHKLLDLVQHTPFQVIQIQDDIPEAEPEPNTPTTETRFVNVQFEIENGLSNNDFHELLCEQIHEHTARTAQMEEQQYKVVDIGEPVTQG